MEVPGELCMGECGDEWDVRDVAEVGQDDGVDVGESDEHGTEGVEAIPLIGGGVTKTPRSPSPSSRPYLSKAPRRWTRASSPATWA
jgi:hypothetical protein